MWPKVEWRVADSCISQHPLKPLNLNFNSLHYPLSWFSENIDRIWFWKLQNPAWKKCLVNICWMKKTNLLLISSFIHSSFIFSVCIYWAPTMPGIARNIKREKTRPILKGLHNLGIAGLEWPILGPNNGNRGTNTHWISMVTCMNGGLWKFSAIFAILWN